MMIRSFAKLYRYTVISSHLFFLSLAASFVVNNETCATSQEHSVFAHTSSAQAQALLMTGYEQFCAKKYDTALCALEQALALDPNNHLTHILVGDILSRQQHIQQAHAHYLAAYTLNPDSFSILYRLVDTEKNLDNLDQAYFYAQKLLTLEPHNTQAHILMAEIYAAQKNLPAAITCYQQAITAEPTARHAYKALGDIYWAQGDFLNAWATFKHIDSAYQATAENPWWDGVADPTGKTILIIDGGGFAGDARIGGGYGNTFQTFRYVQELKKKQCTIIVESRPELVPLLSLCPYIDMIISQGDNRPAHDLQTTTGRLLQNFNVSPTCIIHKIPYLYADQALTEYWKKQFQHDTNFKIGICWCAKQYWWCRSDGTTGLQKQPRSMPVDLFLKITAIPGISVYSLQKTYGEHDAKHLPLIQFGQDFDQAHGRFMDTAAVIKNLDLIITVDTAIAHLAGALGVPVWTLLQKHADGRWLSDPATTPWYPTMRLFRQSCEDDWESVMQQVASELTILLSKRQS
jgi:Tfp pilus assembly protein PilF